MKRKFTLGDRVLITDRNVMASEPHCELIPGMHNAIGEVKGRYEDLVGDKLDGTAGRIIVEIQGLSLQSSIKDTLGVKRPTWYAMATESISLV